MSDIFYLSLPSTASSHIYPENSPGKFKVKLAKEIYLPESEWEVALSSISFPSTSDTVVHKNVDFQKLADMDFLCGMKLEMDGVKNHKNLEIGSQSYWLRGSVLKYELSQALPIHGGDFWNSMLSLLNRRLHSRLPLKMNDYIVEDKTYQKKRPKWPVFFWEDVGCSSYRMCIDNGGIGGSYIAGIENDFYIHLDVAKAFKLVIPKQGVPAHQNGYELTSLLTFEHFRDPISEVNYHGNVQRVWEIVDAKTGQFKPEGNSSASKFLRLECSVNWFIYRLCQKHTSQVKASQSYQERPLYVYTDLVQTQIMGGSETDLLREVIYNGSKSTFEPHHLQFIPIRKNKFDTLEIGISETDGTQTAFLNSNDETVVTLCFKKRPALL